jgi:hypothetical protein
MSLVGLRRRLLSIASLFLVLSCLMAVGVVCTCSSDHSLQALERVIQSTAHALPALVVVWFASSVSGALALVSFAVEPERRGRASPQVLQRFLF